MSKFFIDRPIFAWVIALVIMLAGGLSILSLPVNQYPAIAPPAIAVQVSYPGASAETVQDTVVQVIEQQMNGIDNLRYISSESNSDGSMTITVTFEQGTDPDIAQVQVQNKLQLATPLLPQEVQRQGIRVTKAVKNFLMVVGVVSTDGSMTKEDLSNYIVSNIQDPLSRTKGVGDFQVFGSQYSMRIWLDPAKLNSYQLTPGDVSSAIQAQNVQISSGQLGGLPAVKGQQLNATIIGKTRLQTAEQFENILLKVNPDGSQVRLKDVADVGLGGQDYSINAQFNGSPASGIAIKLATGANALDTAKAIRQTIANLEPFMPQGMKVVYPYDTTPVVSASIHEVVKTLGEAILLVFLVMYLFLQNFRATLIPTIAVPVVLLGTFGVLAAFGFSINTLTMFGMVLAIGLLVDDAIVVVENIARRIEEGDPPIQAAITGARQVGFTVLSMTLSLVAVFIPLLLMGGLTGRLFREFAVTLSAAILVSLVVSLTLTPMLCARLLRPLKRPEGASLARRSDRFFAAFMLRYRASLGWALEHSRLMVVIMLACIAMNLWLFVVVPKGFLPQQDSGRLRGYAVADQSISFQSLSAKMGEYRKILSSDPAVENVVGFIGGGRWQSSNTGSFFVTLKPIGERDPVEKVLTRLRERIAKVPGAALYLNAGQDVRLGGRDSNAQYEFTLRSDDLTLLREWAPKVEAAMRKLPQLVDVNSDSQDKGVQTRLVIDRDRAATLGINVEMVDAVLNDSFGQRQVSTIFNPLNQYRVVMEVDQQYQQSPEILRQVQVIGNDGQRVPLSAFSHYEPSRAPLEVNHQGQFAATTLSFNLAPGAQIGPTREAIMQALEPLHIPVDVQTSFEGNAGAVQDTQNQMPWLILLALLAVYIVLGILYESYVHPLTILSTLPSAGVGALLALILCRSELSLIALIGIILLIGIVKKNAIMMIDFALEAERNHGLSPREAILEACMMRFRPIMMTTLAALLGALPLIFGIGGDAALRRPLGITIVGGLIGSQLLTLYTTPVVYLYLDRLRHWVNQKRGVRTDGALETPL